MKLYLEFNCLAIHVGVQRFLYPAPRCGKIRYWGPFGLESTWVGSPSYGAYGMSWRSDVVFRHYWFRETWELLTS